MSGSKWGIILGGWGVVEEIFSVGGVGGVEWGWVHCLIMLVIYMYIKFHFHFCFWDY